MSLFQRRPEVDKALIARAAKLERDALFLLLKAAVHQHVYEREQLARRLAMSAAVLREQILLQRKAGVAPHVLTGKRRAHAPDERQKRALIVRLERFAAQERQAVYIARG